MTRWLSWIALGILVLITSSRAPAALRHHRQRQLWLAYVFVTIGFAFTTRALGGHIDHLPGLPNADQPVRHLSAVGASTMLLGFMTTISDLPAELRSRAARAIHLTGTAVAVSAVAVSMAVLFVVASPSRPMLTSRSCRHRAPGPP